MTIGLEDSFFGTVCLGSDLGPLANRPDNPPLKHIMGGGVALTLGLVRVLKPLLEEQDELVPGPSH